MWMYPLSGFVELADHARAYIVAPDRRLAVNTNGGERSCVHPGKYGHFTMIEAVEELRDGAGRRQVHGAKLAIAHGNGGVRSSQTTAIFGSVEAL